MAGEGRSREMKHNLRSLHTNRASPSPYWRYPFAADDEVGSPLVPWTSGGTSKARSAKADGERLHSRRHRRCAEGAGDCDWNAHRESRSLILQNWRLHIHRRNSTRFWLVDCFCLMERQGGARALFQRLLAACSSCGLLSEEYDAKKQRQVGNLPQAFSHVLPWRIHLTT